PVSQNARPNDTYKRNPGVAPLKNKAKMSAIFKEMALTLFRVPEALPSSEAAHATLLLTHVAWNRALGETCTDAECRRILRKFEKSRPALWAELRSHDWKSMINDLIEYKKKRYPYDKRIVVVCGINPKKNIHVEWHYPSSSDVHV
ncbi:MAG: hypothetical protein ACE5JA_08675, partial [bacterium]